MSHLDLTREWLVNVLRPYPSRDRIVAEVMKILNEKKTLSVKTDAFTFNSGQTALLLLLHGTLPISYRGAIYQIPIHLWIPHEYPRAAPMAFVVPTKEMGVRKGREVDPSGRVKEDVVDEWWRGWQTKDINTLLQHLTSIFSAAPPVYAKPPETSQAPASPAQSSRSVNVIPRPTPVSPSSSGGAPYVPSRPGQGQGQGQIAQSAPVPPGRPFMPGNHNESLPQYRPAPTPPPQAFAPTQAQAQVQGSHSRQSSASYPAYQPPGTPPNRPGSPVVPARPARIAPQTNLQNQSPVGPPGVPQRPYMPRLQAQTPYVQTYHQDGNQLPTAADPRRDDQQGHVNGWNAQTQLALPQQQQPMQPQSQEQQQRYHTFDPAVGSYQQYNGSNTGQAPQHPSYQPPQIPQPPTSFARPSKPDHTLPGQGNQALQAPRQPVQDLLSSPDSTSIDLPSTQSSDIGPPPLPPSKPPPPSLLHLHSILLPHLQASLPPLLNSLHSTRAHLVERREDLDSGEPAIRDEMARLEAVKKVCDSTGRKLADLVSAGEDRVAELESRGETSVDELVCGISIVHNQLIDLVAEDNAIEDTIYHMTRAFDAERVDLDRYLKSIRSLAREQYMKRALTERILQGMGQKQGW